MHHNRLDYAGPYGSMNQAIIYRHPHAHRPPTSTNNYSTATAATTTSLSKSNIISTNPSQFHCYGRVSHLINHRPSFFEAAVVGRPSITSARPYHSLSHTTWLQEALLAPERVTLDLHSSSLYFSVCPVTPWILNTIANMKCRRICRRKGRHVEVPGVGS